MNARGTAQDRADPHARLACKDPPLGLLPEHARGSYWKCSIGDACAECEADLAGRPVR